MIFFQLPDPTRIKVEFDPSTCEADKICEMDETPITNDLNDTSQIIKSESDTSNTFFIVDKKSSSELNHNIIENIPDIKPGVSSVDLSFKENKLSQNENNTNKISEDTILDKSTTNKISPHSNLSNINSIPARPEIFAKTSQSYNLTPVNINNELTKTPSFGSENRVSDLTKKILLKKLSSSLVKETDTSEILLQKLNSEYSKKTSNINNHKDKISSESNFVNNPASSTNTSNALSSETNVSQLKNSFLLKNFSSAFIQQNKECFESSGVPFENKSTSSKKNTLSQNILDSISALSPENLSTNPNISLERSNFSPTKPASSVNSNNINSLMSSLSALSTPNMIQNSYLGNFLNQQQQSNSFMDHLMLNYYLEMMKVQQQKQISSINPLLKNYQDLLSAPQELINAKNIIYNANATNITSSDSLNFSSLLANRLLLGLDKKKKRLKTKKTDPSVPSIPKEKKVKVHKIKLKKVKDGGKAVIVGETSKSGKVVKEIEHRLVDYFHSIVYSITWFPSQNQIKFLKNGQKLNNNNQLVTFDLTLKLRRLFLSIICFLSTVCDDFYVSNVKERKKNCVLASCYSKV